jgi:tyrosyl-DNA phosphodiesterase-1
MTTYGFEHELVEPIAKGRVKLLLVNDNSVDKEKDIIEECYQNYPNWKLIMPSKKGGRYPGAFHPKIWMLKFPSFLRIVIGSQNLHVGDWTVWA